MRGLKLHVPAPSELGFRQRLMADPATMAYNRGCAPWDGCHPETGCIDFPESDWPEWYDYFIGNEPERWYAYIVRGDDGARLGEVNVHRASGHAWHDMGIVIDARYRGQGYAEPALRLLLDHAFREMGVDEIRNAFELQRVAALKAHLACGFRILSEENGTVTLSLRKEEYPA